MSSPRVPVRLLHYWWPLALGWSTALVIQRATAQPPDPYGLLVLLFGIGAAYSLDRVVDAPAAVRGPLAWLLALVGVACAAVCAWLLSRLPLQTAILVPIVGVAALLYPRIKQIPLLKTVVVATVWTWCAIALPYGDGSWLGWRGLLLPVALPVMLLMASGCLLCDLKDEASDRAAGVASGPVLLGATRTTQLALLLAGAAACAAAIEHRPALLVSACALALSTLWPKTLATEAVGPLFVDMILTLPGILIATHVF